jgi:hypothetical protein
MWNVHSIAFTCTNYDPLSLHMMEQANSQKVTIPHIYTYINVLYIYIYIFIFSLMDLIVIINFIVITEN